MEIIKLIINIIKKFFKYLFILIVIGGIVYGAMHFWQENENKKEAELNLAFFTTDKYTGSLTKGVKWSPVSTWESNNNARANYQYGYNSESGEMFFREVRRDTTPPIAATYFLYKGSEDSNYHLGVNIYWIVDCAPDSSQEFETDDENIFELKCDDGGEYLYTQIGWNGLKPGGWGGETIDALGFSYSVDTSPFNMDEIKQNATLMNLKSEGS
tara:strand:- start:40 stop:678 length:639 start_codon:yes stop_codon:yes gene_type:complete